MREFWRIFICVFITSFIYEFLQMTLDFHYNLFSSDFNWILATLDMLLYLIIFMPIYYLLRRFIIKAP